MSVSDLNDCAPLFRDDIANEEFSVIEIAANYESDFEPGTIELYTSIVVSDPDEGPHEYYFNLT